MPIKMRRQRWGKCQNVYLSNLITSPQSDTAEPSSLLDATTAAMQAVNSPHTGRLRVDQCGRFRLEDGEYPCSAPTVGQPRQMAPPSARLAVGQHDNPLPPNPIPVQRMRHQSPPTPRSSARYRRRCRLIKRVSERRHRRSCQRHPSRTGRIRRPHLACPQPRPLCSTRQRRSSEPGPSLASWSACCCWAAVALA